MTAESGDDYQVTYEILEGFMGMKIPVVRLHDGVVTFLIPTYYLPGVIKKLTKIQEDHPWTPS